MPNNEKQTEVAAQIRNILGITVEEQKPVLPQTMRFLDRQNNSVSAQPESPSQTLLDQYPFLKNIGAQ